MKKKEQITHFVDRNYFSSILFCHHAYFLAFAYHMMFTLFILTNHVVQISNLYPFQFSSSFLLFPFLFLPSLIFTLIYEKDWFNKELLVQLKTTAFSFLKRNKQHFLDWTTLWGSSLSCQSLVEYIFPSCIHSHRTITKITLGKQKRMTRGNLIAASNYSSSQSPEEYQETQHQRCILAQLVQRDLCFSVWRWIF